MLITPRDANRATWYDLDPAHALIAKEVHAGPDEVQYAWASKLRTAPDSMIGKLL